MLPSVGADSVKIVRYAADVAGRILGIAAMSNLVPDPDRRNALTNSGNAILASAMALDTAYVTRTRFDDVDQRVTLGKGKAIDRGFDAIVATIAGSVRTSLPDRNHQNPDYRAVFPNGTEEFTSPTIREDEQIASDLRANVAASNSPVKTDVLALLDSVIPVVGPAAKAVMDGEKQYNALFQAELNARKNVVDTLWEQRKNVEMTLGRAGKGLSKFIFFDFRKNSESEDPAPTTPASETPPPNDNG